MSSKVDQMRSLDRRPLFTKSVTPAAKPVTDKRPAVTDAPKPVTDKPLAVEPRPAMTGAERQAKWRADHPELARQLDRDRKRLLRG